MNKLQNIKKKHIYLLTLAMALFFVSYAYFSIRSTNSATDNCCYHECKLGEPARCDGNKVQVCSQCDNDKYNDWCDSPVQCGVGEFCFGGVCKTGGLGACVSTCATGPGCRYDLGNAHSVSGECCGSGTCYDCDSGYWWDSAQSACVVDSNDCINNPGIPQCASSTGYLATTTNRPPEFTGTNLPIGSSGNNQYEGFLEATDMDGDKLIWKIVDISPAWPNPGLNLFDTTKENQKRIFSPISGPVGETTVTISIDDGRGGITTKTFNLKTIDKNPPVLEKITNNATGVVYYDSSINNPNPIDLGDVVIGSTLDFNFVVNEKDGQYPVTIEIQNGPSSFTGSFANTGAVNPTDKKYHGDISAQLVDTTKNYDFVIVAKDSYGGPSQSVYFKLNLINHPPTITSSPNNNAIGCLSYSYDVDATDPDNHNLTYSLSAPFNGLNINPSTGLITGEPEIIAPGPQTITVTVKDQYHAQTNPTSNAEVTQTYTLNIANESFNISNLSNGTIYVMPTDNVPTITALDLYHSPFTYFGFPTVNASNNVTWSKTTAPNTLPAGIVASINSGNGQIQSSATDNYSFLANNPYTFSLNVTATTQTCNISNSASANITVRQNEWCGDSVTQNIAPHNHGEECDDGNTNNTDQCDDCQKTICGDGIIQNPNGAGIKGLTGAGDEQCDDGILTAACDTNCIVRACGNNITQPGEQCDGVGGSGANVNNQYACTNCNWSGGYCGDGIIQSVYGESCDDNNQINGDGCSGSCQIESGWGCSGTPSMCVAFSSCLQILTSGNSVGDGIYKIDPDGIGGVSPFDAYCDMTNNGGGWTLIMKIVNSRFDYHEGYWTNSSVLNENNFQIDYSIDATAVTRSKYNAFNAVSFQSMRSSQLAPNVGVNYVHDFGISKSNAKDLFSGSAISISDPAMVDYFNSLAPGTHANYGHGCAKPSGVNLIYGPGPIPYSVCDWQGLARFGSVVSAEASGNFKGIGWGHDTTFMNDKYYNWKQLLWVK